MRSLIAIVMMAASTGFSQPTDKEQIQQVVQSAYIDGIQNRGNAEDIRSGFHPSFNMIRVVNNEVKPLSIEEWIANIEKARKSNEIVPRAEGKFVQIDISGSAAVVKLELFREGKRTFTDYLALYKFQEGWRIVSKTFYRHP